MHRVGLAGGQGFTVLAGSSGLGMQMRAPSQLATEEVLGPGQGGLPYPKAQARSTSSDDFYMLQSGACSQEVVGGECHLPPRERPVIPGYVWRGRCRPGKQSAGPATGRQPSILGFVLCHVFLTH